MPLHNVFISYHHEKDQWAKNALVNMNELHGIYAERSVRDGEISDQLPTETIRKMIRDNWLRKSTVTILLVGEETRFRKFVDWELKTSMIDGAVNKRSGILVIMLPSTGGTSFHAPFKQEKEQIYSDCTNWFSLKNRSDYVDRYPMLPERVYDNLVADEVYFSVTTWNRIERSPANLRLLIELSANARSKNKYDTSRKMRMSNYNP